MSAPSSFSALWSSAAAAVSALVGGRDGGSGAGEPELLLEGPVEVTADPPLPPSGLAILQDFDVLGADADPTPADAGIELLSAFSIPTDAPVQPDELAHLGLLDDAGHVAGEAQSSNLAELADQPASAALGGAEIGSSELAFDA